MEGKSVIKNKTTSVFETIKSTRDKLIQNWKENSAFLDKNLIHDPGLISAAMGTVALLLPVVAMGDEKDLYDKDKLEEIKNIVEISIKKINGFIEQDGFTASPFIAPPRTASIFSDGSGYVDSITWVISICALARYACLKKYMSFSKETDDIILALYAKTLKLLIDAQHDDGTWGFHTDKDCAKSLYFTYSAGTCLADVFDYTFAEIQSVEESNEDIAPFIGVDTEAVSYIESHGIPDLQNVLSDVRYKLSYWLISKAIPRLPAISDCTELPSDIAEELGIWDSSTSKDFGVNYYNLYYTYYIIDLAVQSCSDKDYEKIVAEKGETFYSLKEELKTKIRDTDYKYYFDEDEGCPAKFVLDYIEQSTHASRYHMASAMRTGVEFWNTKDSELQIVWKHNNPKKQDLIKMLKGSISGNVTEPVIVPMALRANTQYTYYISQQPDVNLDKLFENILSDRGTKDTDICNSELWDTLSYSLPITERAIEAIIDYYDYVCKYDLQVETEPAKSQNDISKAVIVKSEIDEAIERKIEAVVQEKLKQISLSAKPSKKAAEISADPADLVKPVSIALNMLAQEVSARINTDMTRNDDPTDNLIYNLRNLFSTLERSSKLSMIRELCHEYDKTFDANELATKAFTVEDVLDNSVKELYSQLVKDIINNNGINLVDMYLKLSMFGIK